MKRTNPVLDADLLEETSKASHERTYSRAVAVSLTMGRTGRRARRAGITVRSGVERLIAACAIRHGLAVLHHDRDYAALGRVSELQQRQLPGANRRR